jgi:hypothetical protein
MGTAAAPFLPAGVPAPSFSLTAVASGRRIDNATCVGKALVLVFHDQTTLDAPRDVNTALRETYDIDRVIIASCVDLSAAPRFLHGLIKRFMRQAYQRGAAYVPADQDPADYVLILPDWEGAVSRAFRIPRGGAAVVVVDPAGRFAGGAHRSGLGSAARQLVEQVWHDSNQ